MFCTLLVPKTNQEVSAKPYYTVVTGAGVTSMGQAWKLVAIAVERFTQKPAR